MKIPLNRFIAIIGMGFGMALMVFLLSSPLPMYAHFDNIRPVIFTGAMLSIGSGAWAFIFKRDSLDSMWAVFWSIFTLFHLYYSRWLEWDSAVFLYIAKMVNNGLIPYLNMWDHKMPGIYLIDAVGLKIGNGTLAGVFLVEFIWHIFTVFAFFLMTRKLLFREISIIASFLFGFIFALADFQSSGNFTESYVVLPVSLAILFQINWLSTKNDRTLVMSGICWGIGFWIRQTVLSEFILILITSFFYQKKTPLFSRPLRSNLIVSTTFLFANLVFIFPFIVTDTWKQFFDQAFIYNFEYLQVMPQGQSALFHMIRLFGTTLLPLTLACLIYLVHRPFRTMDNQVFILAWFVGSLASAIMSRRYFGHYFIEFLAPFVMIASFQFQQLQQVSSSVKRKLIRTVVMVTFASVLLTQSWYLYRLIKWYRLDRTPSEELAFVLQNEFETNDTIVGLSPEVLFMSDLRSGSRYLYPYPLEQKYSLEYSKDQRKQYVNEVLQHPPDLIYAEEFHIYLDLLPDQLRCQYQKHIIIPYLWVNKGKEACIDRGK